MSRARYTRALALLCCLGVASRLMAVVVLRAWEHPHAFEHESIARNLVEGLGFSFRDFGHFGPTSVQSPTYPFLLAGLFKAFGTDSPAAYAAALVINCLLGALATLGIARMLRAMGGLRVHGLVAAGLLAIWPTQVYAATQAQAVAFITTCTIWMTVLFLVSTRSGEAKTWLGYSLVAVIGSLTEPILLPISALSGLLILFWRPLSRRTRLRNAAILMGAAILVIGPWTLRNWLVHGTLMPVKSSFWVNVWKGANDLATGTDRLRMPEERRRTLQAQVYSLDVGADHGHQYDALTPEQLKELTGKNEIEREAIFRRYATAWIRSNPRRYAELCLIRLRKSVWIDWDNPRSHNAAYIGSRALLLLLSIPGLFVAAAQRWRLFYPLALVASVLAINTLTLTAARFAIPLEPFQLAVGAATILWLRTALLRGGRPAAG